MRPSRFYLVCATQRSGSTLLCHLLSDTGVAGDPREFFEACAATGRPPHPGDFLSGLAPTGVGVRDDPEPAEAPWYSSLAGITDYRTHLTRTFQAGTTPNGVFGAKLMYNQLIELQTLASTLPEFSQHDVGGLLTAMFEDPAYVWWRRRDTVRQAVSMWKALQTRRWRGDARARRKDSELEYSFSAVDHLVRRFEAEDAGWGEFFATNGLEPLIVSYEDDLERDREGTVALVLSHLGVTAPPGWAPQERLERQADAISENWVAAYHRDRAARNRLQEAVADGAISR